jgi:hypothetical protein
LGRSFEINGLRSKKLGKRVFPGNLRSTCSPILSPRLSSALDPAWRQDRTPGKDAAEKLECPGNVSVKQKVMGEREAPLSGPHRRDAVKRLRRSYASLRRLRRDCVSAARLFATHVLLVSDRGPWAASRTK